MLIKALTGVVADGQRLAADEVAEVSDKAGTFLIKLGKAIEVAGATITNVVTEAPAADTADPESPAPSRPKKRSKRG